MDAHAVRSKTTLIEMVSYLYPDEEVLEFCLLVHII